MRKDAIVGIAFLIATIFALGLVFYINVNESLSFLADPKFGDGLGRLCSSLEDCREFCHNNFGRCSQYCEANPSNSLCNEVIAS